jgi:phosphopantothenoylcysteine decarboxylase/phosphopantothenate--cysteine ligase
MNHSGMLPCTLQGKRILFCVSGSIAVFKAAGWVHAMTGEDADVTVVMTRSAVRFVTSLTFGALSGSRVFTDMFGESENDAMAHITLPRETDAALVAPATAQTIARLAHGMADDLLSASILACKAPVVVCPAMNTNMLTHPATQRNLATLRELGYTVVEPGSGRLACGEQGAGRLPEWPDVREVLLGIFVPDDMVGQKVLITAGPTREPLDPARYLSNRSSGKMGYALARTARRRGAKVTLVTGPVSLDPPPGVEIVEVITALDMQEAVRKHAPEASVVVKAAAVADYRPVNVYDQKLKKTDSGLQLDLIMNPDILAELGRKRRSGQLLVGFAAESRDHEKEGRRKLEAKNVDLIVVNDILGKKTGFDVDTNQVTLISRTGIERLELMSKEETANRIWDKVLDL